MAMLTLAALFAAAKSPTPTAPGGAQIEFLTSENAAGTPCPHLWEQMFVSGRAVLALRDSYRKDVRLVKVATGFS
jgi:xylan 1,4-beta-xylosidase